ncbi:MAG TPA: tetratricopeptide repeat protein [Phycisphaerae bacterium]|nr:tetratricopeptide repeat protein [Phycisphaerae bacterium]
MYRNTVVQSVVIWAAALQWLPMVAADEGGSSAFTCEVPSVSSSSLSITYQVGGNGGQVTQVDAFVTHDEGQTWRQFASQRSGGGLSIPQAHTSGRLRFTAESDGLYGFFIVLHNAAGASSPSPTSGTAPQQWIRVDREAPIVQILEARPDEHFNLNRDVTIRWTAQDADLPDRPVSLHYRSEQTKSYRLIAELLEASGSFRWTAPEDLSAPFSVKATAIDRAGNVGRSIASDIALRSDRPAVRVQNSTPAASTSGESPRLADVTRGNEKPNAVDPLPDTPALIGPGEPVRGDQSPDRKVNQEAQRKYDSGTWHRLRGETDLALARYREALDLDPHLAAARHDLAALLLLSGQPEEAEKELRALLVDEPTHRAALKSLALVQTRRQNYRSAGETLQRLLLLEPDDAEAWLYFGDVAMFMGDRAGARASWAKVADLQEAPEAVRSRAAERMKLYPGRPTESGLASGEPEP